MKAFGKQGIVRQGVEQLNRRQKTRLSLLAAGFLTALLFLTIGSTAWASYTTTQLTNNSAACVGYEQFITCYDDSDPQINDSGQVVWYGWDGKGYDNEIFLYSGGVTTQLTDNAVDDRFSRINTSGQVVWDGGGEIFLYSGGVTTQLTDDGLYDHNPQINDAGQVVWTRCDGTDNEIFLYSGGVTTQLTDNVYDYDPQINDSGQVVWSERNGTNSGIFLYSGGVTTRLSYNYDYSPPQINDSGQVVWSARGIFLYSGGTTTQISNSVDSYDPQINDSGQVVWHGWGGNNYDSDVFLYSGGTTTQLSVNAGHDTSAQINNSGQVVWAGSTEDNNSSSIFLYSGGVITQLTGSDGGYSLQINTSGQVVWDGGVNIFLANPSCSEGKPSLSLSRAGVYWASYADYLARSLSVDYQVTNTGGATANDVRITGSAATNGVTLTTPMPVAVGNLGSGSGATHTLKYHVPGGVISFMATVNSEAKDGCGSSYMYP